MIGCNPQAVSRRVIFLDRVMILLISWVNVSLKLAVGSQARKHCETLVYRVGKDIYHKLVLIPWREL